MKTLQLLITITGFILGSLAHADSLYNIELKYNESLDPPGYVLDFSVIAKARSESPDIVVKMYQLKFDGSEFKENVTDQLPVQASADAQARYIAEDGSFQYRVEATLEAKEPKNLSVVLPYSAMAFERGEHTVLFTVEYTYLNLDALKPEPVTLVSRTEPSLLRVGENVRTKSVQILPAKHETIEEDAEGFLVTESGSAESVETMVLVTAVKAAGTAETVPIKVEGGFERDDPEGDYLEFEAVSEDFLPKNKRMVRFVTNRRDEGGQEPVKRFGHRLGTLTYGSVLTNIPIRTHQRGQVEKPKWWRPGNKEYFSIEALSRMPKEDFMRGLSKDDVLIYVHGYNTDFQEAVLGAAQIQHDLEFGGEVMAFTWPSHGKEKNYDDDAKNASASYAAFEAFITDLVNRKRQTGKGKIHILAHSMGSRVVLNGVEAYIRKNKSSIPGGAKYFGALVFAAADVDIHEFSPKVRRLAPLTEHLTFYYSKEDVPLSASSVVNNMSRAGRHPVFLESGEMDTINADAANSPWVSFGHSYFARNDRMLTDLNLLIVYGLWAKKRQPPLNPPRELPNFQGYDHFTFKM